VEYGPIRPVLFSSALLHFTQNVRPARNPCRGPRTNTAARSSRTNRRRSFRFRGQSVKRPNTPSRAIEELVEGPSGGGCSGAFLCSTTNFAEPAGELLGPYELVSHNVMGVRCFNRALALFEPRPQVLLLSDWVTGSRRRVRRPPSPSPNAPSRQGLEDHAAESAPSTGV